VALESNKAAYAPGDTVRFKVNLVTSAGTAITGGKLRLTVFHLGEQVGQPLEAPIAGNQVELSWAAPSTDFQGYSVEVEAFDDKGVLLASETNAVDVSSSWLKFPRYGYVSSFGPTLDGKAIVEGLKAYHINALQYYDWQWKHHVPLAGTPDKPDETWPDLARRTTSRATIQTMIATARGLGMASMQYNLIYGAAVGYTADGVSKSWGLYDSKGGQQWYYPLPSSWTSNALFLFNPANTDWQKYILDRELDVFKAYDFDGWHADTVGDPGIKYDGAGNPVDLKQTFKPFLNYAKDRMGSKLLIMNAVGNKGHEGVNASRVDAAYVEVWPWDGFADYGSLKGLVDQTRTETGGKSVIIPAYMNYDFAKKKSDQAPGEFNEPGVLLTEASVLAAGGSRLELGDDVRMLCNEYFPNKNLVMSAALKAKIRYYYDFAVAYQNLLRDGQTASANAIEIDGATVSANGTGNTVWAYAKQDARYETVNLINLRNIYDTAWRDTNATQKKPTALQSFKLKYYTGTKFAAAYVASPDLDGGRSKPLAMDTGSDSKGAYVSVTVPSLDYWNLVYFKKG
jgi:dextranase